jgi:hypothetical protein
LGLGGARAPPSLHVGPPLFVTNPRPIWCGCLKWRKHQIAHIAESRELTKWHVARCQSPSISPNTGIEVTKLPPYTSINQVVGHHRFIGIQSYTWFCGTSLSNSWKPNHHSKYNKVSFSNSRSEAMIPFVFMENIFSAFSSYEKLAMTENSQ